MTSVEEEDAKIHNMSALDWRQWQTVCDCWWQKIGCLLKVVSCPQLLAIQCVVDHSFYITVNKCIGDDTKAAARQSPNCIKKQNKMKYGEKPLSVWQMEFLHPAMWHVALESWQWIQVAAPCIVIRMTYHWIRPNIRHIGILPIGIPIGFQFQFQLVSILISPQSTCHSAPVCEILSKYGPPSAEEMLCQFPRWRISAMLDFSGPIMGSLKSPGTTSYRSSIHTIALKCLVFEKIAFLYFGDRQTNRGTASMH